MNKCKFENVIYEAFVSSEINDDVSYIRSTRKPFKNRLYEHRASFPKPYKKRPTKCKNSPTTCENCMKKTRNIQLF